MIQGEKKALSRRLQKGQKCLVPGLEVQELTRTDKLLGLNRFLLASTFWNRDISAKPGISWRWEKTGIYQRVVGHTTQSWLGVKKR